MTVYVITEGYYSDYHIKAVFTDEEQAKLYCAAHEGDDIRIEQYDTEYNKILTNTPILKCWHVPIGRSGPIWSCMLWRYTLRHRTKIEKNHLRQEKLVYTLPESKTEEEARKIMSDFYAQLKADDQSL